MKQKLQYAYSICVLVGVFVTAFLMMSREEPGRAPLRAQSATFQSRAEVLDPAVSQLFEMEDALNDRLRENERRRRLRGPADLQPIPLAR